MSEGLRSFWHFSFKNINMAINIQKTYETVLYVLNTAQSGHLTTEEFNSIATQAQLDIYEQYFYDLANLVKNQEPTEEYADKIRLLEEKMDLFKKEEDISIDPTNVFFLPSSLHKLNTVHYYSNEVVRVNMKDYVAMQKSPLIAPTEKYPVYYPKGDIDALSILPSSIGSIKITYMSRPSDAILNTSIDEFGDITITGSNDIELHSSEQPELITRILAYAGYIVKDPSVVQTAVQGYSNKDSIERQS